MSIDPPRPVRMVFSMPKSVQRGRSSGPGKAGRALALHVLVVENHSDTRQGIQAFLKTLGYRASFAEDKAAALALAAREIFDVLLSDISLPDGNGWDLLQDLETRGRRPLHAIAMSGLGNPTDQNRSHDAGFEMHLVKPFRPEELEQALRRVADSPVRVAADAKPARLALSAGELRQRMHDGLCQHLVAAALLQGALANRLEAVSKEMAGQQGQEAQSPLAQVGEIAAECRQISRLIDEALKETLCLMRELI